ncbi:hypothetical protein BV22DRAFT_251355 [Leucogyrophana mollusca]|uniref:Uncharacterized protein n=1 Tax=Leucogyrophana mollusca TaxID=85980 RepID=A0ACB8BRU5_9AGAM|nr:hypothetical protein BV22DRAFT_251355 [Leucogyrophana mollusca]
MRDWEGYALTVYTEYGKFPVFDGELSSIWNDPDCGGKSEAFWGFADACACQNFKDRRPRDAACRPKHSSCKCNVRAARFSNLQYRWDIKLLSTVTNTLRRRANTEVTGARARSRHWAWWMLLNGNARPKWRRERGAASQNFAERSPKPAPRLRAFPTDVVVTPERATSTQNDRQSKSPSNQGS